MHGRCGHVNRPAGPGGVKIVATRSTGKIGVRGCSFMGRGETSPGNDAAFLEHRVYTLFGKLAAPTFLTPKSWPTLPRPLASILAKGTSNDTMPTVRGRLWAAGATWAGHCVQGFALDESRRSSCTPPGSARDRRGTPSARPFPVPADADCPGRSAVSMRRQEGPAASKPLASTQGYAAMPAPSGVSHHGRCGPTRYGPFARQSCRYGH